MTRVGRPEILKEFFGICGFLFVAGCVLAIVAEMGSGSALYPAIVNGLLWGSFGAVGAFIGLFIQDFLFESVASKTSIKLPPGIIALRIAEFIYSRKKYEMVLQPIIVDMCEEYFEALAMNRPWKARWVHVRGVWSFGAAVVADLPISAIGLVKKLWIAAN